MVPQPRARGHPGIAIALPAHHINEKQDGNSTEVRVAVLLFVLVMYL